MATCKCLFICSECLSSCCVQWRFSWDRGIKRAIWLTYLVVYQPDCSQRQCYGHGKEPTPALKGTYSSSNRYTEYGDHLPTWMHCFVTFKMPLIYLLSWGNICMREYLWHGCSITEAFLSSYEMKEIQLSHTNLPQPFHSTGVNFCFGCNCSFLFIWPLFCLIWTAYLNDAPHINLKRLFLFGLFKNTRCSQHLNSAPMQSEWAGNNLLESF